MLITKYLPNSHYIVLLESETYEMELIPKSQIIKNRSYLDFRKCIEVQCHLRHPNIQELSYYEHDDENLYVFREPVFVSLQSRIMNNEINEKSIGYILSRIMDVQQFMHQCHVYMPITVDNIFFDNTGILKVCKWMNCTHNIHGEMSKTLIGELAYECIYRRRCKWYQTLDDNGDVIQVPQIIYWSHTPISDTLRKIIESIKGDTTINDLRSLIQILH